MIPHIHYDINVKAYVMIAYIDLMQCVFSNPTGAHQHVFAHIHSDVTVGHIRCCTCTRVCSHVHTLYTT